MELCQCILQERRHYIEVKARRDEYWRRRKIGEKGERASGRALIFCYFSIKELS
jgi:hypothetical protein